MRHNATNGRLCGACDGWCGGADRYDAIFVLGPLDPFEDPADIVGAKDREIRRVHELVVQGYYDAGYKPVFVPSDSAAARPDFICAKLRLPKPSRGA